MFGRFVFPATPSLPCLVVMFSKIVKWAYMKESSEILQTHTDNQSRDLHDQLEGLETALPVDLQLTTNKRTDCAFRVSNIYISIHTLLTTCRITLRLAGCSSCLSWIGTHAFDLSDPWGDETMEGAESCVKTCEDFISCFLLQSMQPKTLQRKELFYTSTVGQASFAVAESTIYSQRDPGIAPDSLALDAHLKAHTVLQ
ncbi:hypothetical protein T440DRAFT_279569 [Plenodomus tracheiphilus IPT5]|uniref:Uncharacterized protein n=1 Tax=Plenodomus tracheiphilus IPT5 TaxID=1408161 RepID=A0A6A7ASP2_9PLEO|nr:hypothetical protein T440DRAFT_279569 [Plenodomus tracheiphilus IPT5]